MKMCSRLLLLWITLLLYFNGITNGQHYTDCERPPKVENANAALFIDDEGTFATATYSCGSGYELHGEPELICNADTDVWKGELPSCKPVGSVNTANSVKNGEEIEISTATQQSVTTSEQIESEQIGVEQTEDDTENSVEPAQTEATHQTKKKKKVQDVPEDNSVDDEFVQLLDVSCVSESPIAAPAIDDAFVLKYARRRKGDKVFLVAIYECDEEYELQTIGENRLYCSERNWIGLHPKCIPKNGDEYSEGNEDYDNGDTRRDDDEEINTIHQETTINNAVDRVDADKKNENTHEEISGNDPDSLRKAEVKIECGTEHGCDHDCSVAGNRIQCACHVGFYLDESDGKTCHDIDECRNPDIDDECDFGCENTLGSYRCLADTQPKPPATQPPQVTQQPAISDVDEPDLTPIKACGDGFTLDADKNCVDIDECADGKTGCEHCQNAYGNYQCVCPEGFELAADEKTCQDIDECTAFAEYDYDDTAPRSLCSHECLNTVGSWMCRCPANYHLQSDKRACAIDFCQHLGDAQKNKTKCSHECVDHADGYECKCPVQLQLASDGKTCTQEGAINACDDDLDQCSPGECIDLGSGNYKCNCPKGYDHEGGQCLDVNECVLKTHQCSHECVNIDGAYTCGCSSGFQIGPDQHTCEDIDECLQQPDLCANLYCQNTIGGYVCNCPKGQYLSTDGQECITADVGECANDNGGCTDICAVVDGNIVCECSSGKILLTDGKTCVAASYCDHNNGGCQQICNAETTACECFPGFTADGKSCEDNNECHVNNGGCDQTCVNTDGGFECACHPGYAREEETESCIDVDECKVNNGNCEHQCTNILGTHVCTCRDGYRVAGVYNQYCEDIDECEANNGNCSHICLNLGGGYRCSCPEGQFLVDNENTCEMVDECAINNGGCSHQCKYSHGVILCLCPAGYQLESDVGKNCVDINECNNRNGGCAHKCQNTDGGHECSCNFGFQLGSDKGSCIDLDECIDDNGNCSNICINLLGGYMCACEAGYELDLDKHTCVDMDECSSAMHDCTHLCVNVPGTYECTCPPGLELSRDHFTCTDINECEVNNTCAIATDCVNTIGSFHCSCSPGHRLSPLTKSCVDIDECLDPIKVCSHECRNKIGAFECLCPIGMELAPDGVTCEDVNECERNGNNGGCSHACENVEGSFRCTCRKGYELAPDAFTCEDLDECELDLDNCDQGCSNTDGGFECICDIGFELDEAANVCVSSDPCAIRNGGCAHVCEVREGRALCFCYRGFELSHLDNSSCIDIDECLSNHGCAGKCINTQGSYKCSCQTGYRHGDNGQCIDVDECAENNGGCSQVAQCLNLLGSFRCICPSGYRLGKDKLSCEEIKDQCKAHAPPENGHVRCTRSRHRTQNFYRTRCVFTCKAGYRLAGPSEKICNGNGGWDAEQPQCISATCPKLALPDHGTYSPPTCFTGDLLSGDRCVLHCATGFKPETGRTIVCDNELKWSPAPSLRCLPERIEVDTKNEVVNRFGQDSVQIAQEKPSVVHIEDNRVTFDNANRESHDNTKLVSHESTNRAGYPPVISGDKRTELGFEVHETARRLNPAHHVKPFIKCPQDTTIILPKGQKTVYIKLEQPKTNVDWWNFVDAHPSWAKHLEAHLTAGIHLITFRARSPTSDANDVCRAAITVKEAQPPEVVYCPESFDVQLQQNEPHRNVHWKEPQFRSHRPLKQIFKTRKPGEALAGGVHRISYIATDVDGLSSKCDFTISVKGTLGRIASSAPIRRVNRLENHESYLLCPDRPALKLDTSFPPHIPHGCFVKNVRVNQFNHLHRRHSLASNNNVFRHYSTWDSPRQHIPSTSAVRMRHQRFWP